VYVRAYFFTAKKNCGSFLRTKIFADPGGPAIFEKNADVPENLRLNKKKVSWMYIQLSDNYPNIGCKTNTFFSR